MNAINPSKMEAFPDKFHDAQLTISIEELCFHRFAIHSGANNTYR